MAYNTKPIVTDVDGNPISQYYNPDTDSYEPVEGQAGANKVVLYNADGTENNQLSLIPILDKLSQLTGTVIDEETRKSNELQRIDNEDTRQSNEDIRNTNEIARIEDEEIRIQNENTRIQNEDIRQTNEQDRVNLYNDLIDKVNSGYFDGKNLEFHWRGTELGVRVEGDSEYIYVDLKGETGDIDNLTSQHIETALGYTPVKSVNNVTADENGNIELNIDTSEIENRIGNVEDDLVAHKVEKATQEQDGHMTKEDKIKLNGIEEGANKTDYYYGVPILPTDEEDKFKIGHNIWVPNVNFSTDPTYKPWLEEVYTVLGYSWSEDEARFRLIVETIKYSSAYMIQYVYVHSNTTSIIGSHIFTLHRTYGFGTNKWRDWQVTRHVSLYGDGNPEGSVHGLYGSLYLDIENNRLYLKKGVKNNLATNTGWELIGGLGGNVDSVNGKTGEVVIDVEDIAGLKGYKLALGHSASAGSSAVALGYNSSAGTASVALGASASAGGNYSVAIGRNASAENANEGKLGGTGSYATSKWIVPGSFTVNGTKNFEIPHPKPEKSATHVIRHGAVESPTPGDTLYRYKIQATKDNDLVTIDLPDYFVWLNKDVQIFVTPQGHFGNGYGTLNRETEQLEIHCQFAGEYNVLVIGTRNDNHSSVQEWYIKGVEREIGESWTGETYAFSVDEIIEVEEIKEVSA